MIKAITEIDKQTIKEVTVMTVETIEIAFLESDPFSDFHHGFKLFYDEGYTEVVQGIYWLKNLVPSKDKKAYYREWQLTPEELAAVISWLTKEPKKDLSVTGRQILFPKKQRVMTEL